MRGKFSTFNLFPDSLDFKQRMEHDIRVQLLKDNSFNLLARKSELGVTHEFDAKFELDPNLPMHHVFNNLEEEGMADMAADVVLHMKHLQDISVETLLPNLKRMYCFFVQSHPEDGLVEGKTRILTGKVNETKYSIVAHLS